MCVLCLGEKSNLVISLFMCANYESAGEEEEGRTLRLRKN